MARWIFSTSTALVMLSGCIETECEGVSASDDFSFENSTFCTEMGQITVSDYPELEELVIPEVRRVKNQIRIFQNPQLRVLRLPNLEEAALFDGSIFISENPQLRFIEMPGLRSVGEAGVKRDISIFVNPSLQRVDFGSLERGNVVEIEQMTGTLEGLTPELDLSSLVEVDSRLDVVANDIVELDLSSLEVAPTLTITGNTELESLDLSALRSVSDNLEFERNGGVGDAEVCAVIDQLDAAPASLSGFTCD